VIISGQASLEKLDIWFGVQQLGVFGPLETMSYLRESQFVSVTCWKGLSILPGYGLLVGMVEIYATHLATGVLML
jgi:hypothetical protein